MLIYDVLGIRKIISIYGCDVFKISDNFIRVILPFDKEVMATITQVKSNDANIELTIQEQKIVDYIKQYGFIRRSTVEDILDIQRTWCNQILNTLVEKGTIKAEGNAKAIKYILK